MTDKKVTTKEDAKKTAVADKALNTEKPKVKKPEVKKEEKKPEVREFKASARFVKISPPKVRLVADQLRTKSADQALEILEFLNKGPVEPILKLVKSAIANAENNFNFDKKDLFIKTLTVNDAPTMKRFRPRAFGRSTKIRKRVSHIDLVLGLNEGAKAKVDTKKLKKSDEVKVVTSQEAKKMSGPKDSDGSGTGEGSGKEQQGILQKVFSRKTG